MTLTGFFLFAFINSHLNFKLCSIFHKEKEADTTSAFLCVCLYHMDKFKSV
jgi:hypothetical protein